VIGAWLAILVALVIYLRSKKGDDE